MATNFSVFFLPPMYVLAFVIFSSTHNFFSETGEGSVELRNSAIFVLLPAKIAKFSSHK